MSDITIVMELCDNSRNAIRETQMNLKCWFLIACSLTSLTSTLALAESSASIDTFSCSGALTSSLADGVFYSCSGDMTLSGGSIFSDTKIVLESGGLLSLLDHISLKAPLIRLSSIDPNGSILITEGVILNFAGSFNQPGNGTIRLPDDPLTFLELIKDGPMIIVHPITLSVPEPESYAMLLTGLGIITLRYKRKNS